MMSVEAYALDVNKSVSEVLDKCLELGIEATDKDFELDEEAIIMLDNNMEDSSIDIEEEIEEENEKIEMRAAKAKTAKKLKNIKKDNKVSDDKQNFARKKKAMYKSKEKLQSNLSSQNDNVVLYKDNMSIGELAKEMGVAVSELIKKLFSLGLMVNINSSISF